jgi:putative hydrolase of HD superfamily
MTIHNTDIAEMTDYFLELDALKLVNRKTYIDGGTRLENSAEHSWHLAMACWSVARKFKLDVSEEKLLKLALVHDLGEIDAGDTMLYATERNTANIAERECVKRLESHAGNGILDLADLWEEQETGHSPETKLLKTVDRLLPFLHNVASDGKTWRENTIKKSQVMNKHAFIADDFPEIHNWMLTKIELAVAQGWLVNE